MGKASRKKAERQRLLDRPALWRGRGATTLDQAERLRKFKEWTTTLDLSQGDPITFTPVPTWRQVFANRELLFREWENQT